METKGVKIKTIYLWQNLNSHIKDRVLLDINFEKEKVPKR